MVATLADFRLIRLEVLRSIPARGSGYGTVQIMGGDRKGVKLIFLCIVKKIFINAVNERH